MRWSPRKLEAGKCPWTGEARTLCGSSATTETSYWQSDANEMAAIKTILIIVNSKVAQRINSPQNSIGNPAIEAAGRPKQGQSAANSSNVPLTTSVIG
jgi:hypothetical protein